MIPIFHPFQMAMARFLQDYAWADAGAKVKVYIEVPLAPGASDDSVRDSKLSPVLEEKWPRIKRWSYGVMDGLSMEKIDLIWFFFVKIDDSTVFCWRMACENWWFMDSLPLQQWWCSIATLNNQSRWVNDGFTNYMCWPSFSLPTLINWGIAIILGYGWYGIWIKKHDFPLKFGEEHG